MKRRDFVKAGVAIGGAMIPLQSILARRAFGQVAQAPPLPGNMIPQFVDPLPLLGAPTAQGGSMEVLVNNPTQVNPIYMREFNAHILPTGLLAPGTPPPTRVWGYRLGAAPTGARYLLNDPAVPNVATMIRLAMEALGLTAPVRRVPEALAMTAAFLAEAKARLTGSPPFLSRYAVKAMGRRCFFSIEGTSRKLAWSPRTKAEDGIAETVRWFRASCPRSLVPPPDPGARR